MDRVGRRQLVALAAVLVSVAGPAGAGPDLPSAAVETASHRMSKTLSANTVAAGLIHSCVLTGAGGVKCWGYNGHNELGDATTVRARWAPVDVSGLGQGVTAIAAGVRHTCSLTRGGGVKCWGYNYYGQLGDGTTTNRSRPVDVAGLSRGATGIAAAYHTCALTSGGGVECWGLNDFGQLGDGTTDNRSTPVDVSGLSGVIAIAVGSRHSCALTGSGGVKCWGDNSWGQLGDGTTVNRARPVAVSGLTRQIRAIAADRARSGGGDGNTCALTRAGGVKCWGNNWWGQLGDGTTVSRRRPVGVSGLSRGVTGISVGGYHSCARTRDGGIKCWGLNLEGELGDGTTVNRRRPVDVVGFAAAKATLAIVSKSVRVTNGRIARITMRCGSAAPCRGGRLALWARVPGSLVGSPSPRVSVTLGTTRFSLAEGRAATVDVQLNRRGFEAIVHLKRLVARLRARYRQPTGPITAAKAVITLLAPSARPRHQGGEPGAMLLT